MGLLFGGPMSSAIRIPKIYAQTIATGGTRQKLLGTAVSKTCYIELQAPAANTSSVFYGDVTLSATNGIEIPKGTSRIIQAPCFLGLESAYIVSATTGDKLNVLSWEQL